MEKTKAEEAKTAAASTASSGLSGSERSGTIESINSSALQGREGNSSGTKSPVRTIESPKYGLALSPIQKFMRVHSPRAG
jgi:hypothetical protein